MILIAGCNGHVGRELLKKASAPRLPVRCFDLAPPDLTGLDASAVEVATGDITSPEVVQAANALNLLTTYIQKLKSFSGQTEERLIKRI